MNNQKILNICYSDYANFMWDHTEALRFIGLEASALKLVTHPFDYASQAPVVGKLDMAKAIEQADIIQIFHSCLQSLELVRRYARSSARIVAWHTGSPYRNDPDKMNLAFNDTVELCFTDQCEFAFLGAKNLHYMAAAIDTRKINHAARKGVGSTPRVFAHYPSNPETKGTKTIQRMMVPFQNRYRKTLTFDCSIDKMAHPEQMQRMRVSDVYIELFKPTLLGRPYGCFGVTAFEAAAMGKVVVTQNIFPNVYPGAYGRPPMFYIANNEREFETVMEELVNLSPADLLERQESASSWIHTCHSYGATGAYWRNILSLPA